MSIRSVRRPLLWLILCVLLSLSVLAYPLYVIRPFRYQGPHELAIALAVTRYGPSIQVFLAAAALVLLWFSWRQARGLLRRGAAVACALFVLLCAILSRINVYELLFHPMDRPTFSAASKAKLDSSEMVIAVHIGGAARAYPIRSISYHHIVNDTLAGFPIVATY